MTGARASDQDATDAKRSAGQSTAWNSWHYFGCVSAKKRGDRC